MPDRFEHVSKERKKRYMQILTALPKGRTQQDIGDSLGLSKRTVEDYTKTLHKLFNTRTLPQLVYVAFKEGYIT